MTSILGISAFYHDSAAALVVDGQLVAAAQEERFTRKKHDDRFPSLAIEYCLQEGNLSLSEIDYVGFYDKPLVKFERLLETYLAFAPRGFKSYAKAIPVWLSEKLNLRKTIRRELGTQFNGQLVFTDHHESHAASAFFPSPFAESAILTMDGVGEWSTTCWGVGRANRLELRQELRFPHSVGLLYSAFTYYLGFKVNSGEYKVMGLAPYGSPRYRDEILSHLMALKPDGSYWLDMKYFNFCQGLTMTSDKFHDLFGGPPRDPRSPLTQKAMDLAASIQDVTEEVVLRAARHVQQETGLKQLVMAGGVALNCVANGRVLRETPFEQLWIQPAAGDAGGAVGTALFIWHQLLEKERQLETPDGLRGSLLGPEYSQNEIEEVLHREGAIFTTLNDDEAICCEAAKLVDKGRVVGWFQGRMEFGPRALGNRSILGDARSHTAQSVINQKVKFRESFRPFAPAVLEDEASRYFDISAEVESPYMLLVAAIQPAMRRKLTPDEEKCRGIEMLGVPRSTIPAVTHVDNSARIQSVDRIRNPLFHRLLSEFQRQTGCSVMINTSFNVRGEPIVCTPEDAFRCFLMTDLDALVIGRSLLLKPEQRVRLSDTERSAYLSTFEPD